MAKSSPFPQPKKRFHHGAWAIIWHYADKQYLVSTGLTRKKEDELEADIILRQFAVALSQDEPDFPDAFANKSAVTRYCQKRYPVNGQCSISDDWLEDYKPIIKSECVADWARTSIATLKKLQKEVGDLRYTTPDQAVKFLSKLIEDGNKVGTRNRVLAICSRFYNWAVITKRLKTKSPFSGIKTLKEERSADIVYCTPVERDEFIMLAHRTGYSEWLAVPIAFYSGLRREEIARLEWSHIRFNESLILVMKSKTKVSRAVELSSILEEYLRLVPKTQRTGYVVKCSDNNDRPERLAKLTKMMKNMKEEHLLGQRHLIRPVPSKSKAYKEKIAAYNEAVAKVKHEIEPVIERIGWNSFRHTFASLKVQAGVSMSKVCHWLGNTLEVCELHYAQFKPRGKRDTDIDKE